MASVLFRDPLGKLLDPLRLSIKQARTDLRHCEGELDTGAKPLWVMAIAQFLGRPCGEEVEVVTRAVASHACSALITLTVVEEEVIPVLYVEDAARAVAWYERLGFSKEWEHQFDPGFPLFVSVARGRVRLYLSEHKGDARPNTLIHLNLKDIDAVSAEFRIPVDEEGLAGRECELEDLDGNRLRVATPRS